MVVFSIHRNTRKQYNKKKNTLLKGVKNMGISIRHATENYVVNQVTEQVIEQISNIETDSTLTIGGGCGCKSSR